MNPARGQPRLVVAIDGPAGAGKTTVARGVARALGIDHIDTGAMYRALTWKALRERADLSDGVALARLARAIRLDYAGDGGIVVDGRRVRSAIRTARVSRFVSQVAAHPQVRRELVRRQREAARSRDAVIEGRDIGTVVCPDAPLKVFLTASPGERARRRHRELARSGSRVTLPSLQEELVRRDRLDATRAASPLAPASDAVVIDSTGRSPREVVAEIVALARRRAEDGRDARRRRR